MREESTFVGVSCLFSRVWKTCQELLLNLQSEQWSGGLLVIFQRERLPQRHMSGRHTDDDQTHNAPLPTPIQDSVRAANKYPRQESNNLKNRRDVYKFQGPALHNVLQLVTKTGQSSPIWPA